MTPSDYADLLLVTIGFAGWYLVMHAPIPGAGDDDGE